MIIDITGEGYVVTSFKEDLYVRFPSPTSYQIRTSDEVLLRGTTTIENGLVCVSDVAKGITTLPTTPTCPFSTTIWVSTADLAHTRTIFFTPSYSDEEPIYQTWCYKNIHHRYSFTEPGEWDCSDDGSYEAIIDLPSGEMGTFITPCDQVDGYFNFWCDHWQKSTSAININPCYGYALHYVTPQNGWATFCLKTDPREKHSYERVNTTILKHTSPVKVTTTRSYTCSSSLLSEEDAKKFWMILESPYVILETPDGEIPVRITSSE